MSTPGEMFDMGYAAALEAAAKVAEDFSTGKHIAADLSGGEFPKQTRIQDAIAAAIRALAKREN